MGPHMRRPLGSGAAPARRSELLVEQPLKRLLDRLPRVRQSGAGYRADCPNGHVRARGTISITENPDGSVLMLCFACRDTPGVLATIDLTLADLYPRPLTLDNSPRARAERRRHFRAVAWSSALAVAAQEARIVQIAAASMSRGYRLEAEDLRRVAEAAERLQGVQEVMRG